MAATATHATTYSILSSFLPRLAPSTASATSRSATLYSRQLSHPFLPRLAIGIPSAISLNIPGLIEGIWESILKAVPKKKTSHMKKRHRQMAGKGLKDVTSLNRCSSCGAIKRAHLLCPVCLDVIKSMFKKEVQDESAIQAKAVADAKEARYAKAEEDLAAALARADAEEAAELEAGQLKLVQEGERKTARAKSITRHAEQADGIKR